MTLDLDDWQIWQTAQRLSRRTITERIRVLRLLHTETGIQPVHVDAPTISAWTAAHADDWSDSTACAYNSYLRAWFRWLCLTDRRTDNPMVKIGTPRPPDREPRPVSDDDVARLLTTRMWKSTLRMILLALLAGLRVHEIARVRGEDIDLGSRLLWVKGKGRKLRSVPLHPILVELASEMPERGWWFPMHGCEGEPQPSKSVSRAISEAMRRAGVRGTAHCLRHWYATTLLAGGADLLVVRDLLRHKSVATTQIYARCPDGAARSAIDGLDPWRATRPPEAGPRLRAVS